MRKDIRILMTCGIRIVLTEAQTEYSFSLREKARMREYKIKQLSFLIPIYARHLIGYTPTLSLRKRE
jgi:hypothetical protein